MFDWRFFKLTESLKLDFIPCRDHPNSLSPRGFWAVSIFFLSLPVLLSNSPFQVSPSTMSSETATASTSTIPTNPEQDTPLFTCLSCQIAFPNPEDQRTHYRSDLHRYNMKRRVANLPPVKTAVFNEKVLAQRKAAGMMLPTGNVAPGGDLQQRADQMEPEDQEKKVEHGNRCDACR